jgi:DNA polymerase V
MTRGGKREGAGRKIGSGTYGEATTVMRVPKSAVEEIKQMLIQFPNRLRPEPGGTKVEEVFAAAAYTNRPVTLYSSRVAAGLPSPAEYYEEETLDLNDHLLENPQHTFFVRVTGDSMINAGIHPGDLLIVDRSLRPNNGRIVIAVVNGELTVKKLFKERGKLFLMPENPSYPCIEINENMDFMIWGVVTNVIHSL